MRLFFTILMFTSIVAYTQEVLVWSDEFTGTVLNEEYWSYELGNGCPNLCGWGNNELQSYTNSNNNIKVQNGNLVITAINNNNNWTSARIRSINKFDFCLGRVEVRAKIPAGRGFWPAAWFLPSEYYYGTWPISGEIDLLETRGQEPEKTLGTIHYGPLFPNNQYTGGEYNDPSGTFAEDYHVFEVNWTSESIIWKVDGVQFTEKTRNDVGDFRWPFDRNFHALLNFAVGGNFLGNPDATTPSTADFTVDYIRVYQDPENTIISGPEAVFRSNDQHLFYVQDIPGYSVNWIVPPGTQIIEGQGTSQIEVVWGFGSGDIQAELIGADQTVTLSHFVQVLPDSCSEVFDDREAGSRIFWVGGDGGYSAYSNNPSTDAVNPSTTVSRYERNGGAQYDVLQFSNDLVKNATLLENESKKIEMKFYSNAPIGTEVQISLEKRAILSQPYPNGRRTLLNAFTTKMNEWELLTFEYVTTPDGNTQPDEIDQLTVLIAPNTFTNSVSYIDDWAVKEDPCLVASNENFEINKNLHFQVYPNPFTNKVNVEINFTAEFILTDLGGRILYQGYDAKVLTDFTANLKPAVYFIQAISKKETISRKLIKQ